MATSPISNEPNLNITDDTRLRAAAFISQNYPDPIPPNSDPEVADQQAAIDATEGLNTSPSEQDVINPENDPEIKTQIEEAQAQNDTSMAPAEQTEIDPEEDPFEQARLNAEAELDVSPTEQAVIDSGVEPLSQDEQAVLEAYQADNRERLSQEEAGGLNEQSLSGQTNEARGQATKQDTAIFQQAKDWRVRLSLAPGAQYLYNVAGQADVLFPLKDTNGVVFPYTPSINVTYAASYDPTELTHTNYKFYQYKSSYVGDVQITADFTAQDTTEAKYLLAVIHFFKSVTKMFYGKDTNPVNGVPPPLCFLSGYGPYQFDNHPLAITNFNYSLPNDVDYIRTGSSPVAPGVNLGQLNKNGLVDKYAPGLSRLFASGLKFGGVVAQPAFTDLANTDATYVPTKMQLVITGVPIVSRNNISNTFSLRDYATGKLNRGSKNNTGGMW